jgi:two-component system, OmpR family, response regulator RpaA
MSPSMQLLLIEDDEVVARTIQRSLRGLECQVYRQPDGPAGLAAMRQAAFDLVILDVALPGMDGYTVARQMRADPLLAHLPILFLTAHYLVDERLEGFRAGGDDYLGKPFNVEELGLRVQAILRRTQTVPTHRGSERSARRLRSVPEGESSRCLKVGAYSLDTRSYELFTNARGRVRLTPVQFDLLYHLMSHPGQPFTPARLLDELWDYPVDHGSPDLVRVHIKTLRSRVEDDPRRPTFICTVPGRGYMVQAESE